MSVYHLHTNVHLAQILLLHEAFDRPIFTKQTPINATNLDLKPRIDLTH